MMKIWNRIRRSWGLHRLAGLALLAGATAMLSACYGTASPFAPPSPDMRIDVTQLSYTPANPLNVGDNLVLQATTDGASASARVVVTLFAPGVFSQIHLRDDGIAPDATAGDLLWAGEQICPEAWSEVNNLQALACVVWDNGYQSRSCGAQPITIHPK